MKFIKATGALALITAALLVLLTVTPKVAKAFSGSCGEEVTITMTLDDAIQDIVVDSSSAIRQGGYDSWLCTSDTTATTVYRASTSGDDGWTICGTALAPSTCMSTWPISGNSHELKLDVASGDAGADVVTCIISKCD